jgi:AraC family transcriptional regulator of adaptative response/methylated-DNA-[protein]-cysteine methyltransferase
MNRPNGRKPGRASDYGRVEQALGFIGANFLRRPSLGEIAQSVHLSEYHFERLFKKWAGTSPQHFARFLTKEHAKKLLGESRDLLDVTFASGLSSPGRLHDLFVTYEAVSPGEFSRGGGGVTIRYGFQPSPFGECLLGVTGRGICALEFLAHRSRGEAALRLRERWPEATISEDHAGTAEVAAKIFGGALRSGGRPLHLLLRGTNFQIKVWEALLRIPKGCVLSYGDVARLAGEPHGARAVGTAVALNPIAYLIPCHRVIRSSGAFGEYRWGQERKMAILGWESIGRPVSRKIAAGA